MTLPSLRNTVLFLFALAAVQAGVAQANPAAAHRQDECGALGCIPVSGAAGAASAEHPNVSVAPVVIRATSADVPGVAAGGPGGAVEAGGASRHDFEDFVASTLGHSLPLYGRGLFSNAPASFVPADHVGVPADYVIGPGDELILRSWGKVDLDARVSVDRNGQIFLPVVGAINVAGVPYQQLQHVIETAMKRQYRDFQLSVTLGQLRSIQIFVLGRTQHPGAYVISALSTLVDALFASGGPSATGSLRDIQLRRNGRTVAHLDLYDLLLRGDKSADVPLIAGDVLFIPVVGMQVAVDGDVNTPAIYEVRPGADISSLISDAGGLTSIAGTQRSTLEHVVDHEARRSDDLALDASGIARPLHDGDILRIFPISPRIENSVTLRGNVAQPGRYTWHDGMRVSDLIPNPDFLLTRAYFNAQNGYGTLESEPFQSQNRSRPGIAGQHGTEINWNYAAIERLDPADLSMQVIPFALGKAIARSSMAEDKLLKPGDIIEIYTEDDVLLPQQSKAKFVRIDGEVVAPGTYRLGQGETLQDLVRHAGGFTANTYLYASQLMRESVRVEQEAKLRHMLDREEEEVLSPVNQTHRSSDSPGSAQGELALRQAYLARLREIHPTGRIVLDLRPDSRTVDDVPAFALEDGDHYFLPAVPGTVYVLGNVYNEGAQRFQAGEAGAAYVSRAGGATRDADRKREFVLRADGTVVSHQAAGNFNRLAIFPGDAIVVPPRLTEGSLHFDLKDWVQTLSSFSLTALAIKALKD